MKNNSDRALVDYTSPGHTGLQPANSSWLAEYARVSDGRILRTCVSDGRILCTRVSDGRIPCTRVSDGMILCTKSESTWFGQQMMGTIFHAHFLENKIVGFNETTAVR